MFVRTYVRAYVTLENIVVEVLKLGVCVCNKFQWWYSDPNIPGNWQQSRFPDFSIFMGELNYFKSWVALMGISYYNLRFWISIPGEVYCEFMIIQRPMWFWLRIYDQFIQVSQMKSKRMLPSWYTNQPLATGFHLRLGRFVHLEIQFLGK